MAANKSRASSSLKKKGNVINMDAESSKGDTVVFALAIALGVAMIVVIVLICVYANKRNSNGNDDSDGNCQGSEDTKYIEIDVLTQETPTTVLAESAHAHPQHHKVPHTHPHPHLNHQVPHPHPLPLVHGFLRVRLYSRPLWDAAPLQFAAEKYVCVLVYASSLHENLRPVL